MALLSRDLRNRVSAGESLRPWLLLGPFYEDIFDQGAGFTFFERPTGVVGHALMIELVRESRVVLRGAGREGDPGAFRAYRGVWNLVRRPDRCLAWGRYFLPNHLVAAFLTALVSPEKVGMARWRLRTRLATRVLVAVNGEIIHDNALDAFCPVSSGGWFEYLFDAPLQEGLNRVSVALLRLGRMAQVSCRLELLDGSATVEVPLPEGSSPERRSAIEREIASLRLPRDVFYAEDQITLRLDRQLGGDWQVQARLLAGDGQVVRQSDAREGEIQLGAAAGLPMGEYHLDCFWQDGAGRTIASTRFNIGVKQPVASLVGQEHLEARRRQVLEYYATNRDREHIYYGIYTEVARYALGRYAEIDEGVIREMCQFLAARKDCSDFGIHALLRLLAWEQRERHLSAEIDALMKEAILGWEYWVDEPGQKVMIVGTENHRFLCHAAEWLAGQLFPLDEFTNSGQRGLYHATKGRMYLTEWIRQRGRFGFDEWHSNSYYPVNLAPLLNVHDFALPEDGKLKQLAAALLDYMCFVLAADTFGGVFGATHGRSYSMFIRYPEYETTAALTWLLYGQGALSTWDTGMGPASLAASDYRAPGLLSKIATDRTAVVESRQRSGLLPGAARSADFIVYRTPDYLLSAVQDYRKGEYETSAHVAQVTLTSDRSPERPAVIFWSCPHTTAEGAGARPDYWSGNSALPRAVQYRNVLALTFRLGEDAWMSHCWFEPERFDEVRFCGHWVLARAGRGYVGLYSEHGYRLGEWGQYAGRELICGATENIWLVECGRQADWGTFEAFVGALTGAHIQSCQGALSYDSPIIGRFVAGWEVPPTVNGEAISLHGYPLLDSPWGASRFGSGEMTLRCGEEHHDLWFNL